MQGVREVKAICRAAVGPSLSLSHTQMSGMFESWMHKLVSAVMQREREANVIVVDWLSMAQQLYPDAVNHTHGVGLDIATMINWLQVCTSNSCERFKNPLYTSSVSLKQNYSKIYD